MVHNPYKKGSRPAKRNGRPKGTTCKFTDYPGIGHRFSMNYPRRTSMNFFYFVANRESRAECKVVFVPADSFVPPKRVDHPTLFVSEENPQTTKTGGYILSTIGTIIYKDKWGGDALDLIAKDLEKGQDLNSIMKSTRGQFCLIVYSRAGACIVTDMLGSFPVFRYEDEKGTRITNLFLSLAKYQDVTVNPQAVAEYVSFGYSLDRTFFNEISLLKRGTIYVFGTEHGRDVYCDYLSGVEFDKYSNLAEITRLAKDMFLDNFKFLSNNTRILSDLTGGFDTRTNTTLLKCVAVKAFECGICGEQNLRESELAKEIAEVLGVEHHSDIRITDRNVFNSIVEKHFLISAGIPYLYHSSELIHYYQYIERSFDIHVTGFAGSQLFDQFIPRLSVASSKFKVDAILRKLFAYTNVMRSHVLTESDYYANVVEKISEHLREIGSDKHDRVATFFTLSTFSRYYHGFLLGTHNTIMPVYSPFLEGNIARLLIETSWKLKEDRLIQKAILSALNRPVSLVMTSHGFNADVNEGIRTKALRIINNRTRNVMRQLAYDFDPLLRLAARGNRLKKQVRSRMMIPEMQRSFWVEEVNKRWSDDLAVFALIDKQLLGQVLVDNPGSFMLKARALYLNRLIEECNPRT